MPDEYTTDAQTDHTPEVTDESLVSATEPTEALSASTESDPDDMVAAQRLLSEFGEDPEDELPEDNEELPADDDLAKALSSAMDELPDGETDEPAQPSEPEQTEAPAAEAPTILGDTPVELTADEHDSMMLDPAAMARKLSEVKAAAKMEVLRDVHRMVPLIVMPYIEAFVESNNFLQGHPEYQSIPQAVNAAIAKAKRQHPDKPFRELLGIADTMLQAGINGARNARANTQQVPVRTSPGGTRATRVPATQQEPDGFDDVLNYARSRRI